MNMMQYQYMYKASSSVFNMEILMLKMYLRSSWSITGKIDESWKKLSKICILAVLVGKELNIDRTVLNHLEKAGYKKNSMFGCHII